MPDINIAAMPGDCNLTDANNVEELIEQYFDAFAHDSVHAASFYSTPALKVAPPYMKLLASRADVEAAMREWLGLNRKREYSHSTVGEHTFTLLNPLICLFATVGHRWKADGTMFETFGTTFLLVKEGGGWKIRAVIDTDVEKIRADTAQIRDRLQRKSEQ